MCCSLNMHMPPLRPLCITGRIGSDVVNGIPTQKRWQKRLVQPAPPVVSIPNPIDGCVWHIASTLCCPHLQNVTQHILCFQQKSNRAQSYPRPAEELTTSSFVIRNICTNSTSTCNVVARNAAPPISTVFPHAITTINALQRAQEVLISRKPPSSTSK